MGPNKFRPPKILGPKVLVKIGFVRALTLLPWINIIGTNGTWTNGPLTYDT